jgi:hypothetical protein
MEDGAMRLKIAVSEIPENTQHTHNYLLYKGN